MDEKLKSIAKGRTAKTLIEILEGVQNKVADIRTPMAVNEHQEDIRLGVIQVIEEFLVMPIKRYSKELEPGNPNEYQ